LSERPIRVLLIEDDPGDYDIVREYLAAPTDERFDLEWVWTYESGVERALSGEHDAILVDYRLGAKTGAELVNEIKAAGCKTPVIFFTGAKAEEAADRAALKAGVYDYLSKELVDPAALIRSIQFAIERRKSEEAAQRLRERELEIGSRIQELLLLGKLPDNLEGASLAGFLRASQQVDGDFWGFFGHDPHRFDILVGDVMGKGVPAALLAAGAKFLFPDCIRRLVLTGKTFARLPDPEEIVAAVHYSLLTQLHELETFVTFCYARFDLEARQLVFVDAGHMPTIHYSAETGTVNWLQGDNLPIGVSAEEVYAQRCVPFGRGDLFVFYSDGITEAKSQQNELFGRERLAQLVLGNVDLNPQDMADRILQDVQEFAGRDGIRDDLTCLVVRIGKEDPAKPLAEAGLEVFSRPGELDSLRKFVDWFCVTHSQPPLTEHERTTLVLAVSEATANILNHAYWGARNRRVTVHAMAFPGEVHVDLADWGRRFDPEQVPPPAFDGSRANGFGVYIIEQCVDDHRYYRDELGRNHLRLIRRSGGKTVPAPP